MDIALPIIIVGGLGLFFGVLLTVASIIMHVKTDARIEQIKNILPGANCGGCGFTGCQDYADNIIKNGAPINKCNPGGKKTVQAIADLLGIAGVSANAGFAVNKCHGSNDITGKNFQYDGIQSCKAASMFYSGNVQCPYGCIGLGDCVTACKFDAIRVIDGVARVDVNACTNCGACVAACPRHLIYSVDGETKAIVLCSNTSMGKNTISVCKGGCISCGKCVRVCPAEAITIKDNIAFIDFEKCTGCGKCAEACPTHCIGMVNKQQ